MRAHAHAACRTAGLTRFEFAIAAAVVGVLIAVALPRLDASRVAARQVRLKSLAATAQSSATLFHLQCQTRPALDGCATVSMRGQPIAGVHGFPAASAAGIAAALKLWGPLADIEWRPDQLDGVPALRARLKPEKVAGTCEFIYAQAATPGAPPRIELTDASCS